MVESYVKNAVEEMFNIIFSEQVDEQSVSECLLNDAFAAEVNIEVGHFKEDLLVVMPQQLLEEFIGLLLGQHENKTPAILEDGICEIANMVGGFVKKQVSATMEEDGSMSVPRVVTAIPASAGRQLQFSRGNGDVFTVYLLGGQYAS